MAPWRTEANEGELRRLQAEIDSLSDCKSAEFWNTLAWLEEEFVPGFGVIMFKYEGWKTVAMAELIARQTDERLLLNARGTAEEDRLWEVINGNGGNNKQNAQVVFWERPRRRDDEDRYDPRGDGYGGA